MPLENEMKTPRSFMKPFGVLNISMTIIVAMYAAVGFLGYLRYGHETDGSITLNLGGEKLGIAVKILLAIAIFFTHPIQCYVAIDIIWNEYLSHHLEKYRFKLLWEYIVRTIIILLTCEYISSLSLSHIDNSKWNRYLRSHLSMSESCHECLIASTLILQIIRQFVGILNKGILNNGYFRFLQKFCAFTLTSSFLSVSIW